MKRETKVQIQYSVFVWLFTTALAVAINACSPKNGRDGAKGADGQPGESCVVVQLSNGAEIKCGGNTSAVILDGPVGPKGDQGEPGQDGEDLAAGPYTVVEVIDPCGKQGAFDEVILKLANGQLLAHYASGAHQFFALLTPGNYVTTDGTNCRFTVNADRTVSY